jgi:hypothetical protein
VTTPTDDEHGLEQRAVDSRARLLETLNALERRGAKFVATAHEFKNLAALVIDGVAVLGALSTLLALVRSATRPAQVELRPQPRTGGTLSKLAVFALFAGAAYVARRQVGWRKSKQGSTEVPQSRLRAVP